MNDWSWEGRAPDQMWCCEPPSEGTWGRLVPEELPFLEQVAVSCFWLVLVGGAGAGVGEVEAVNTRVSSTWISPPPPPRGFRNCWQVLERTWIWAPGAARFCVVLIM